MMALRLIPQHAVSVKGFMMAKMGVVYVIRNDEHVANRFKVGQTYDLEKRISELSSETSNIGKFYTIAKFPVEDAEKAEKECHTALKHFRKAKEFFDGPEEEITLIVKRICERYIPKAFMRTDLQHELDELKTNSNITSENKIRIEEIENNLKIEPEVTAKTLDDMSNEERTSYLEANRKPSDTDAITEYRIRKKEDLPIPEGLRTQAISDLDDRSNKIIDDVKKKVFKPLIRGGLKALPYAAFGAAGLAAKGAEMLLFV